MEKDKNYEISCLIYAKLLLSRDVKTPKRAKWWYRLAIDLRHLKMTKESLKIVESGLLDLRWVKAGDRNTLLKMKNDYLNPKKGKGVRHVINEL